jgi:hypothetical protein
MVAKMMARKEGRKRDHSRSDWDEIDVAIMRWCLRVKIMANYQYLFIILLRWTAPRPIVERSRRDRFWGAVRGPDGVLRGENQLGRLLVELRDEALALKGVAAASVRKPTVAYSAQCGPPAAGQQDSPDIRPVGRIPSFQGRGVCGLLRNVELRVSEPFIAENSPSAWRTWRRIKDSPPSFSAMKGANQPFRPEILR